MTAKAFYKKSFYSFKITCLAGDYLYFFIGFSKFSCLLILKDSVHKVKNSLQNQQTEKAAK